MRAGEPCGSDAVGFVGVDESEFSIVGMKFGIGARGAQEFGNFHCGGDTRGTARDAVDGDAASGGALTKGRAFRRQEFGDVMARVEAFEHQERLILSSAPFCVQVDDQNFHERTVPERR